MYQKKPSWLFKLSKLIQNGYSIALAALISAIFLYTFFYQFIPFISYGTGLALACIISLFIGYPMGYIVTMFNRELRAKNAENKRNNEAKNQLINILGHDIRSPLNNVKRLLEMVGTKEITNEELKKITAQLNNDVDNTLMLTNNLINWIRIQKNDFKPNIEEISLKSIIDETITLYAPMSMNKSITINLNCNDELVLKSDPEMLKIIFRNILSNAIKFSHDDGKIKISCSNEGQFLSIAIKDDGTGMNHDQINNIMDNSRTKSFPGTHNETGTGIGLNLTKKIIKRLDGELSIESSPNEGACFFVKLPQMI
jgi:signal transduction histidine kinase